MAKKLVTILKYHAAKTKENYSWNFYPMLRYLTTDLLENLILSHILHWNAFGNITSIRTEQMASYLSQPEDKIIQIIDKLEGEGHIEWKENRYGPDGYVLSSGTKKLIEKNILIKHYPEANTVFIPNNKKDLVNKKQNSIFEPIEEVNKGIDTKPKTNMGKRTSTQPKEMKALKQHKLPLDGKPKFYSRKEISKLAGISLKTIYNRLNENPQLDNGYFKYNDKNSIVAIHEELLGIFKSKKVDNKPTSKVEPKEVDLFGDTNVISNIDDFMLLG